MKRQILLFCLILSVLFLSAREKSSFITITTEQGLTSNTINCIHKDSKNFIWIGTANGLNRFDGIDILAFDNFKNKNILDIAEVDSTFLYILSEKNLYKYNRLKRKNTSIEIENNIFKTFAFDGNKNLYILGQSGIYRLSPDDNIATKIKGVDILETSKFSDIYIDKNDICWLASSEGLVKYDLAKKQVDIYKNNIDNNILKLTQGENNLYVATSTSAILSFDILSHKFSDLATIETPYIQTISYNANKLYVGTNGNGLKAVDITNKIISTVKLDDKSATDNHLNTNAIYTALINDSSFWIGTFSGGLLYKPHIRDTFKVFSLANDNLPTINIRSFVVDNSGYGLYGTRNGLVFSTISGTTYYTTENTPELKSNIILSIHPYKKDMYLVGTYGGGLYLFNTRTRQINKFEDKPIYTDNSFYSVIESPHSDDILWFATLSGLIKHDVRNNTRQIISTQNSNIISDDIYFLETDSSNRIWIATRNGVCYLDENDQIHPLSIEGLPSIGIVRYVYEDSKNNIWLACENQGTFVISNDLSSFRHYSTKDLLPNNYVASIVEDKMGQIWIATIKGIVSYKNDNDYAIYSLSDGLPSYTFNDAAVQKTDNNFIWWGNEKGLVYLDLSEMQQKSSNKINITSIIIDGYTESANLNSLDVAPEYINTLRLSSSENNLTFRFSDFSYDFPSSNIYEYKLEGLDDSWQKTTTGKDVIIPQIPSGKYILKIREAGNNNNIKIIHVVKDKSYTSIYVLLGTVLLILVLLISYKYLLKKIRRNSETTSDNDKVKYQNLKLEKKELEDIKHSIITFMEIEQPYLDPNFKLDDLANAVNYSKIKISQVLNQHLNTNFSNFISLYRIEAFKKKAEEGLLQQYTLSALAKECGFSSRSSFFNSIKKLTGQTPLEFLKESGINIEK